MKCVYFLCFFNTVFILDKSDSLDVLSGLGLTLNNVTGSVSDSVLLGSVENEQQRHSYQPRTPEENYGHGNYGYGQETPHYGYDTNPEYKINQTYGYQDVSRNNSTPKFLPETSSERNKVIPVPRAPVPVGGEDGKAIIDAPVKSCGEGSRRDFGGLCRKIINWVLTGKTNDTKLLQYYKDFNYVAYNV